MPDRTANSFRLGKLLKEYLPAAGAVRKVVWVMLGSACVATLLVCGAVSEAETHEWGGMVVTSVFGLMFALPVVLGSYVLIQGRGARVGIHERGLSFRRGNRNSAVLWSDVESYILATAVRIVTRSGEVIEMGSAIEGIDAVAQTIEDETLKLMLPQIKAAILAGSSAEFKGWKPGGKFLSDYLGARAGFVVDATGITEKDTGQSIQWQDVTGCTVTDETIGANAQVPVRVFRIADQTQTLATRADLLCNAHVLLALCAELSRARATRTSG